MGEHREVHCAPVLLAMEAAIRKAGGVRALARQWKVSAAHVSDLRLGKRGPGPKILRRLRLVKDVSTVIRYYVTPPPAAPGHSEEGAKNE